MANIILISLFALPMIIVIFLLVALCWLIIDTIETNKINFYENIEVVENFLQSNKRFQFEKIENINIDLENEDKGYLKIYPNIHGMDGFFIAKLKRVR